MKRKILFLFTLLLITIQTSYSQLIEVGDSAQVSVLTCSPGKLSYEKFGHTAIRYKDSVANVDMVFNYGIFDFNEKNFYWNFIKGNTYYMLGVYDTKYLIEEYTNTGRQVIEQVLNLSKEEMQQLMDDLMINRLPENRKYLYNFVFDNCATRPRDKIYSILNKDKIQNTCTANDKLTFRQWIGLYTGEESWLKFGIDLVFGIESNQRVKHWQTLFLPDNLKTELENTVILVPDSANKTVPLVKSENLLVKSNKIYRKNKKITYLQPITVTSSILFLVILITLMGLLKERMYKGLDTLLLGIVGLVSIVLLFLMFVSIHPLVKLNYNILWANPISLILAITIWFKSLRKTNFWLFIINVHFQVGFTLVGALVKLLENGHFVDVNIAFLPISIALAIRSYLWIKTLQNEEEEVGEETTTS